MKWDGDLEEFLERALDPSVEIGKDFDIALDSVPRDYVWSVYSRIAVGLKELMEDHPVDVDQ